MIPGRSNGCSCRIISFTDLITEVTGQVAYLSALCADGVFGISSISPLETGQDWEAAFLSRNVADSLGIRKYFARKSG
jgi:hypothetical protein